MKRNMWLVVIPMAVVLVGLAGGRELPGGAVTLHRVTYGKMVPISIDLGNYVCVVFHEPVSVNALPREKRRDMPYLKEKDLKGSGNFDMDQVVLSMIQDVADNESEKMDKSKQKKPKGLFGQQDEKQGFNNRDSGKNASSYKKDVDESWGGGWLSDTILSEEKRIQKEMDSQFMNVEAESALRGSFDSTPAGTMDSERASDRFGATEGTKNGRLEPYKPSFRIESWKPKNK